MSDTLEDSYMITRRHIGSPGSNCCIVEPGRRLGHAEDNQEAKHLQVHVGVWGREDTQTECVRCDQTRGGTRLGKCGGRRIGAKGARKWFPSGGLAELKRAGPFTANTCSVQGHVQPGSPGPACHGSSEIWLPATDNMHMSTRLADPVGRN